jgi:hypothetical protein
MGVGFGVQFCLFLDSFQKPISCGNAAPKIASQEVNQAN